MVKQNPKLFGAELVNMIVADPWLLFMPLGWGRLGRGVVNSIKLKRGKNLEYKRLKAKIASDIKVGATATLATPLVFSTTFQLGENANLDPKRTSIETTIGATAGALFSVGFAGTGELARRLTRVPRSRIEAAHRKVFDKYNQNAEKLVDFNEKGIYRNVDELIEIIRKEAGTISDPKKFDLIKADITAALRTINENGKDMALATALKRAAAVGGIFGTAQFLTSPDEKLVATAKGFGIGAAIYGVSLSLIHI